MHFPGCVRESDSGRPGYAGLGRAGLGWAGLGWARRGAGEKGKKGILWVSVEVGCRIERGG